MGSLPISSITNTSVEKAGAMFEGKDTPNREYIQAWWQSKESLEGMEAAKWVKI